MKTNALPKAAGGRARVRRVVGLAAAIGASFLFVSSLSATDDDSQKSTVSVREERGVYAVTARFHVPQPATVVFSVLTDYERIPRFMPNVERSVVLERAAGRVVVEQDAVSRLMMFSKRVHLELEITERPDALRFRDRSGSSFARYEGEWRLCEGAGGTNVEYELKAEPSFDVPQFMLKRLLKRDSSEMIQKLRQEIAARADHTNGG